MAISTPIKIINLGELNELDYKDVMMSINTNFTVETVSFRLVRNVKSLEFSKGNCKMAWHRLVHQYAWHTACFLLKLKREFQNSKLELVEKDSDEWISNLKGLQIKGCISDEDFRICIMNNFPQEYDIIMDGLENQLNFRGDNTVTIKVIWEQLNHS